MSQGQQNEEPAIMIILIIAVLIFLGWLIWYFNKEPITIVASWLRYAELWVINLFTHKYDACLDWLYYAKFADPAPTREVVNAANGCFTPSYIGSLPAEQRGSFYTLSPTGVALIETEITRYIKWPIAGFLGVVGYYMIFVSKRTKFRTRHNLESFIRTQAGMWPVIAPIVNFNPTKIARVFGSKIPDKLPMFAEAFAPEEWVSWHRITVTNGIPEREATRRAFIQQLGPRWNGIEGLPPFMQGLYAAFALKGAQKREESDDLLGRMSLCWNHKSGFKMPVALASEIKKLVKDPQIGGLADDIVKNFAYRSTAMLGLLKWARSQGGVLAPAQFLWLRGVDRNLWYALNNLGRRSFHTEGAGAMAHYMAEVSAKKALPIPRIDTAVVTLNQYLSERGLPIPPREEPAAR